MLDNAIVFIAGDSKLRLHVGTCSDLAERMRDLKKAKEPHLVPFDKLLWVARHDRLYPAFEQERRLRRSSYDKLVAMISAENPGLRDISEA